MEQQEECEPEHTEPLTMEQQEECEPEHTKPLTMEEQEECEPEHTKPLTMEQQEECSPEHTKPLTMEQQEECEPKHTKPLTIEQQEEYEPLKESDGWEGFRKFGKFDPSDQFDESEELEVEGSDEWEPLRECVSVLATQPHQLEQARDMLTTLYPKVSVANFSKPKCGILIGHLIPHTSIFSNGRSAPSLDMRCLGLSLGCVALQPSHTWLHSCEITYTCVARHERDADLSRMLIGAAVALSKDLGYDWVFMGRGAYLPGEEPFYRWLGFTDKVDGG